MNFFEKTFTINLNGLVLTIFLLLEILLFINFLIFSTNFIKRKFLKKYEFKTGFLGKKLMGFFVLFSMLSVFLLGGYLARQQIDYTSEAEYKIDLDIDFDLGRKEGDYRKVNFRLTPIVDGVSWGKSTDNFDIVWTITPDEVTKDLGAVTINRFEEDVSVTNKSNIELKLLSGSYKVKVLVTFNSKVYEKEISVIV